MNLAQSQRLFAKAQQLLPGGVGSDEHTLSAAGGQPIFIDRGEGAYLIDVDGNRFVDDELAAGALLLGHAPPGVVRAIGAAAARGTSPGTASVVELELAWLIQQFMPSLELLRFAGSDSEAALSALRLARAFTGRPKVLTFEGCGRNYAAPSGDTLVAPYNDHTTVAQHFERLGGEIAAVMVEPVASSLGVVPPAAGFLEALRALTTAHGALLIFDEVTTGFRVHPGGAQTLYGLRPDLTTLGAVIGGGLPLGAYGGRRDILQHLAPGGPLVLSGAQAGSRLAMAAGIETLSELQQPGTWEAIEQRTGRLMAGLQAGVDEARVPVTLQRVGTLFTLFFSAQPVTNWATAQLADTASWAAFRARLVEGGICLPPGQFAPGFLSSAHDDTAMLKTLEAAARALRPLRR